MVKARRCFLDSGAFAGLADHIRCAIRELHAGADGPVDIVDAGCGEGHFLGALEPAVTGSLYGLDVSKEAIRLAARRHAGCRWIVTNTMRTIPFASASIDAVLSVLAPRNVDEFARILKARGHLVVVVPGPDHLVEARALLMADARDYQAKADEAIELCARRFSLGQRKSLTSQMVLDKDLLGDLVQMTPLFWRSTQEAKSSFGDLAELRVTMSFVLLTFTPTG
jgi:23S rRNA (guanine745-N1)-methyltransferase